MVAWILVLLVTAGAVLVVHHHYGVQSVEAERAQASTTQVDQLMSDAESGIDSYLLTRDRAFLQPYEESRVPLQGLFAELDQLGTSDSTLAAPIRTQRMAAEAWTTEFAGPATQGVSDRASDQDLRTAKVRFDAFRTANADLADALGRHVDAAVRQQQLASTLGMAAIVLITLLGALLVVRPSVRELRQLGSPLEDLERTVEKLEGGDLSARADTSRATGAILSVAEALNGFAERNEEARDRLAEEVRLSQLVVDLGLTLTTTLDLDQVVRVAVERVATELDSPSWIRAFDVELDEPGRGRASYPIHLAEQAPPLLLENARRINEHCWHRQTCAVVTRDQPGVPALITSDEGASVLAYLEPAGAAALLFVPIGAGQESLGYLALTRTEEQPLWSDLEQAAAIQVGREVGRAVLLARLFERDQNLIDKVGALDVRRDDFVTMASHALRTPLASIAGHLEIMRSGDLGHYDSELEGSMVAIERNSKRLNRFADDFLLLAQLEDGKFTHHPEPVDLQAICRAAIDSEAERASAGDLSVLLTVHGRVAALGVAAELERAVLSLLSNAIKFSPVGSTVRLSVFDDSVAGTSTVEVVDNGFGISAVDQQRLFTRFFRAADAIEQEVPGTGIGLRIANLVAQKHHGAIAVNSDPDLGTTFTLTLQRAEPLSRPARVTEDEGASSYAGADHDLGIRAGAVA